MVVKLSEKVRRGRSTIKGLCSGIASIYLGQGGLKTVGSCLLPSVMWIFGVMATTVLSHACASMAPFLVLGRDTALGLLCPLCFSSKAHVPSRPL